MLGWCYCQTHNYQISLIYAIYNSYISRILPADILVLIAETWNPRVNDICLQYLTFLETRILSDTLEKSAILRAQLHY